MVVLSVGAFHFAVMLRFISTYQPPMENNGSGITSLSEFNPEYDKPKLNVAFIHIAYKFKLGRRALIWVKMWAARFVL